LISYWGVDHGDEISKADKYNGHGKPSAGRRTMAYVGQPFHGAVAGKRGKKLRATGNEYGGFALGSVGGSTLGATLGAATGKPAIAGAASTIGGLAGGIAGNQAGLNRNQRKGYLKKES
jgi:hypothetical protein